MNKQRRARIVELVAKIEEIQGEISMILDEEQEAFDNLPEGIQTSERGEKMEEAVSLLGDVDGSLEEAKNILEEIMG